MTSDVIQINRKRTSESSWKAFDRCQTFAANAFEKRIEPKDQPPWDPRNFGDIGHYALDAFHTELVRGSLSGAMFEADVRIRAKTIPSEREPPSVRATLRSIRTLVRVTIERYSERWPDPEWLKFKGEHYFTVPIEHPDSHESCPWYEDGGKRDGLVWADQPFEWGDEVCGPGLYLLEHKFQSNIGDSAIEILKRDPQTILYAYATAVEQMEPVRGVLWNLVQKPVGQSLAQRRAETAVEFEDRRKEFETQARAGEIRGNKIRRRKTESDAEFLQRAIEHGLEELGKLEPEEEESDADYAARCRAWLTDDCFHRFVHRPTPQETRSARYNRWARAELKHLADERGILVANRGETCFEFGRPCDYIALCDSGNDPEILERDFRQKPKHKQAREDEEIALETARKEKIADELAADPALEFPAMTAATDQMIAEANGAENAPEGTVQQ